MKTIIITLLLLGPLFLTPRIEKKSEVIFQFKTIELLRFSLTDCPASISAKSHVFPKGTVLTIQGVESSTIYYQIDGATEQPYSQSIRLVAKGEHIITMWISDGPNTESMLNAIKFTVIE